MVLKNFWFTTLKDDILSLSQLFNLKESRNNLIFILHANTYYTIK